jgi:serpin B
LGGIWATRQEGPSLVRDASQGTFIKIDEEGTEAAAVTLMSVVVDSAQPTPVDFRVDAPFVFVIRDEVTGALMFVARVGDPTNRGS